MNADTARAYRAWQDAAKTGYGKRRVNHPGHVALVDARIRNLKARYEALLATENLRAAADRERRKARP